MENFVKYLFFRGRINSPFPYSTIEIISFLLFNLYNYNFTRDYLRNSVADLFYLTRPLLLGEVPQPLLNPPLLRR